MSWQKLRKVVFVVFLVLIISSIVVYQIFGDSIGLGQIREYLKDLGVWAPVVFIAVFAFSVIFLPSTPFMIAAGILFGFKWGFLYTMIGSLGSSIITFLIARKLGKDWVEKILQNKYLKYLNKYNHRLESGGVWDLTFLRLAPFIPLNVLNILMGVSRIKMEDYIAGSLLGLIPSNLLSVYFGTFITKIF